jgi:hypothetical protein
MRREIVEAFPSYTMVHGGPTSGDKLVEQADVA